MFVLFVYLVSFVLYTRDSHCFCVRVKGIIVVSVARACDSRCFWWSCARLLLTCRALLLLCVCARDYRWVVSVRLFFVLFVYYLVSFVLYTRDSRCFCVCAGGCLLLFLLRVRVILVASGGRACDSCFLLLLCVLA